MNHWLRRASALALCLCLCAGFAAFANAEGGSNTMSTEVYLKQQAIILEMPQHTALKPGENALLQAQAAGVGLAYEWRLSRDGGKSFTAAPVSRESACQISNAQPNEPATLPYVYLLTVTDEDGRTDRATVQVLVLADQTYGTLVSEEETVQLTGFHNETAVLVVEPLPQGGEYQALLAQVAPGFQALPPLEIHLECASGGPVSAGRMLLNFQVGQAYNGLTLRVFHLLPGGVEILSGTVQAGLLPIWVDSLSPFLVELPAAPPTATPAPATPGQGGESKAEATATPGPAAAPALAGTDPVRRRPVTILGPSPALAEPQPQGTGGAAQTAPPAQADSPAALLPGGQTDETAPSPALCGCAACGLLGRLLRRPGCLCPWCWLVLAALVLGVVGLVCGVWHKYREHKRGPDEPEQPPQPPENPDKT